MPIVVSNVNIDIGLIYATGFKLHVPYDVFDHHPYLGCKNVYHSDLVKAPGIPSLHYESFSSFSLFLRRLTTISQT